MKKNIIKNKVGRPKLADKKIIKESLLVCLFLVVTICAIGYFGFKILTINSNPKYYVGTVYNTHVNSCLLEDDKIDCGPGVTYLKYKTEGTLKEVNKEYDSIKVDLDGKKATEICYKTNSSELKCIK